MWRLGARIVVETSKLSLVAGAYWDKGQLLSVTELACDDRVALFTIVSSDSFLYRWVLLVHRP
jgi:hypothetical protein